MAHSPLVASLRNSARLALPATALALGACADNTNAPHSLTVPAVRADVATSIYGPSLLRVANLDQHGYAGDAH